MNYYSQKENYGGGHQKPKEQMRGKMIPNPNERAHELSPPIVKQLDFTDNSHLKVMNHMRESIDSDIYDDGIDEWENPLFDRRNRWKKKEMTNISEVLDESQLSTAKVHLS